MATDEKGDRKAGGAGATEKARVREERRRNTKPPEAQRKIKFDDKGNAILDWSTDTPRRREEDNTIDLLECLSPDGLSLTDEPEEPSTKPDRGGFNPYDKSEKSGKKTR
jgi:hypothetical protein